MCSEYLDYQQYKIEEIDVSGGYFNYQQHRIEDIAETIDKLIEKNDSDYPSDIIIKFDETRKMLRLAAAMAQRVDWLASGDDDEYSFRHRWIDEVNELKEISQNGEFTCLDGSGNRKK